MGRIRILVVEDSLTVRKRLCEVLALDEDIEVVGEAEDGRRAIELCGELRPDVVTMDIVLPLMSGLSATEYIMAHFPTPILVVSASTNRGDLFKTYEALSAGAIDVLEKPRGDGSDVGWEHRLVMTVKLVSRIRVITHLRARLTRPRTPTPPTLLAPTATTSARPRPQVVAIGASTGGPGAVVALLRDLPPTFALPILLVIHSTSPSARPSATGSTARPAAVSPTPRTARRSPRPTAGC
jgi:two-component system chemotaxis response regulator CheB